MWWSFSSFFCMFSNFFAIELTSPLLRWHRFCVSELIRFNVTFDCSVSFAGSENSCVKAWFSRRFVDIEPQFTFSIEDSCTALKLSGSPRVWARASVYYLSVRIPSFNTEVRASFYTEVWCSVWINHCVWIHLQFVHQVATNMLPGDSKTQSGLRSLVWSPFVSALLCATICLHTHTCIYTGVWTWKEVG